jgi:2'-5' RNA ligase
MPGERPRVLRLFVACPMPEDIKRGLAAVQDDLRGAGFDRLRFVRPEGVHITLKFLGSVEAERVEAITAALQRVIQPFELKLALDQLGGFGGARLRVVWVGLAGDIERLAGLAGRVEGALGPLGFPGEGRPFAPHLTLARVPEQATADERRRLSRHIEAYRFPSLPPMIVTEVHLMSSILGPGGSNYERLVSFPARVSDQA